MEQNRQGFTLIELMIAIAIILILVTIALPDLMRARRHAHEAAAIKTIQTIHTAQVQYHTQYGRFAASLAELGPPQSGRTGPHTAGLIDANLAAGERSGYRFTVTGNESGYSISAVPLVNSADARSFYSDETLQLRENSGPEPATAQSPPTKN
jgi:type IV pilus assembly protein PilA